MELSLEAYRAQRDTLLLSITETLARDERCVAAWLTGSFSRNAADSISDLDITVVVSEPHVASLCMQFEQVSAKTTPERYAFFSQFGKPALIHENNNNAPQGGTFTFVLYTESAVMVDWVLIPQSKAVRPHPSKLLFEKTVIPVASVPEPEDLDQSRKRVAELWAFFWMMTAITIKYIQRGDGIFAAQWIENLHGLLREIERRLDRQPWTYTRGSLSELPTTREKQLESIHQLIDKIQKLRPKIAEFTESNPLLPLAEIQKLMSLVSE